MGEMHYKWRLQLFSFSNIPLAILLVLAFLMFSGYGIGWSRLPYDEWRILISCWLILLPFGFSIPGVVFCNAVTVKAAKYLLLIYILTLIYVFFVPKAINALSFLLIYSLLFYAIIVYGHAFQTNKYKNTYLIILGFMPLLTVLWLPVESILLFLFPDELGAKAWIGSFINIRQYDDAILPLLFILALVQLPKRFEFIRWLAWALILSGSILNGARAVCISIVVGLLFSIFWYRSWRWCRPILLGIVIAVMMACLFSFLQNIVPLNQLQRYSSSGRSQIMLSALDIGIKNWLFGSTEKINYAFVFHPHNLFLQWWSEYGILGLSLSLFCIWVYTLILKQSNNLPPMAITGLVSIGLNAMLSGSMVYPHTQLLNCILIAFILSLLPSYSLYEPGFNKQCYIKVVAMLLAGTLLILQYPNFMLWGSSSALNSVSQNVNTALAPYWWQHGDIEWLSIP